MNKVSRALQTDYTEPQVPLTSHILHSFLPDSRVSPNCVPHAVQMRRSRVEVIVILGYPTKVVRSTRVQVPDQSKVHTNTSWIQ